MVVPVPSYADIGKAAKDLLGKDYPVGSAKMEFNTTSASGVVTFLVLNVESYSHWWQG